MGENFSRIEDYINDRLSSSEKGKFELELKKDEALAEKYNFYRNFKKQQSIDLEPIKLDKKILPEITNINFTENKQKKGPGKGTAAGILIIFIAVSSYLFIGKNSDKKEIAILKTKLDSVEYVYNETAKDVQKINEIAQNQSHLSDDTFIELKELLNKKEEELAKLKQNSSTNNQLKKELEELKKELAKVKQEYYENQGKFADNTQQNEFSKGSLLKEMGLFTSNTHLIFRWKNEKSYKIGLFSPDKTLISKSNGYTSKEWQVKKPNNGFYLVKFDPRSGKDIIFLVEFIDNSVPKIWLPNR